MRPEDGSLPGRRMAQEGLARVRQAVRSASLPVKILLVLAVLIIVVLALSLGAAVLGCVPARRPHLRSRRDLAGAPVVGGVGVRRGLGPGGDLTVAAVVGRFSSGIVPLLLLPCAAAAVSHLPVLSRRYVPCRTVAWTQLWSLPPALLAWWLAPGRPVISYAIAWAAGPGRDRLADRQVAAGGPGAQPPAGPVRRARRTAPARRPGDGGPAAGRPSAAASGRPSRPAECPGWCRRRRARYAPPTARPPGTGAAANRSRRRSRWRKPWPSSTT